MYQKEVLPNSSIESLNGPPPVITIHKNYSHITLNDNDVNRVFGWALMKTYKKFKKMSETNCSDKIKESVIHSILAITLQLTNRITSILEK